jgi:hypothetical protein
VSFSVKLFTIKGNLVFMNNLYRKVAVASVCTALGFVLGANEEVKAATFTLAPTFTSVVRDGGSGAIYDGRGDGIVFGLFDVVYREPNFLELAELAEFNIGNFFMSPNTFIKNVIFQAEIRTVGFAAARQNPSSLGIFGYVGNGTAEESDFEAGVLLSSVDVSSLRAGDILNFEVTSFFNQRVSNGDAFAGFGIRALNPGGLALANDPPRKPRLIVETADGAEPVPEPITIFGSALALGVGGWLKRKKSSQHNKTTP